MPYLQVSSLSKLASTVDAVQASHVITLINIGTPVVRPERITPENHLFIGMSDIVNPQDGHVLPGEEHVRKLLSFGRSWNRAQPLVIHCWAGVSRSTAAAFITVCSLNPDRDEAELAQVLRRASPSATPNARLVAVAAAMLGRQGRMVEAIAAIGRGADAFEGTPFRLDLA
jgi:predicted protein tyrosine phosphatase